MSQAQACRQGVIQTGPICVCEPLLPREYNRSFTLITPNHITHSNRASTPHHQPLQFIGAMFGALTLAGLVPGAALSSGCGPGCFTAQEGLQPATLLGWELLMTFFFIMVMYASVFVAPGHGDASPLAGGLALYAATASGNSQCVVIFYNAVLRCCIPLMAG